MSCYITWKEKLKYAQLNEIIVRLVQEREEWQQDFDLCYHLKAWGVCRYVCRSYYSPTSSMHFILCSYIPYSGKLSREKTFANW